MKPDTSGSLDWMNILGLENAINMPEEQLKRIVAGMELGRTYNQDGTYTKNGITYRDGQDVNTLRSNTPEQAVRALEAVWERLNTEPLTENDEYNEGWNDAMHLLRQEIDALKGIHTPDRQTP